MNPANERVLAFAGGLSGTAGHSRLSIRYLVSALLIALILGLALLWISVLSGGWLPFVVLFAAITLTSFGYGIDASGRDPDLALAFLGCFSLCILISVFLVGVFLLTGRYFELVLAAVIYLAANAQWRRYAINGPLAELVIPLVPYESPLPEDEDESWWE